MKGNSAYHLTSWSCLLCGVRYRIYFSLKYHIINCILLTEGKRAVPVMLGWNEGNRPFRMNGRISRTSLTLLP